MQSVIDSSIADLILNTESRSISVSASEFKCVNMCCAPDSI